MNPYDAGQLLFINLPESPSTSSDQTKLIRELDYLPLAITQAAAYISARATRMSVSKYLMLYCQDEKSQSRLLNKESGNLRRDPAVANSVIQTWQISFDQIRQSQPQASKLLSLMAMFDRQDIPEFLLSPQYPNLLDFEDALASLYEFSLIEIEKGGETFKMHRLVQLAVRLWLGIYNEAEEWQGIAIKVISNAFTSGEYSNWKICEALSPHAREVLKYKFELNQHLDMRASLLYNMAWYNWLQGQYGIANAESEESLAIREDLLQGLNIKVLESVGMLALVLQAQGKYKEAETLNRRALAGKEMTLGPGHPSTLESMSNLTLVLQAQGRYNEAEIIIRRALAKRETALGSGHPDTLMSVNNLALVLQYQGKYVEAEEMQWRALEGNEKVLGKEHPDTLISMNNLASVLQHRGKYNEAEELNQRALVGQEAALGPEHPSTLLSMRNLSLVLQAQGKYHEAEIMIRRALVGRENILGLEHPNTLTSVSDLASLLEILRDYNAAAAYYQRAVSGYKSALGAKHPTTIACSDRYSLMLGRDTGDIDSHI